MARVAVTIHALGNEPWGYDGCEEPWKRGQQMSAVEDGDGEPCGWFCRKCIAQWERGTDPRFPQKEDPEDA